VVRKVSEVMLFALTELFIGKIQVALREVNNVPVCVVFSSREYLVIGVLAVRVALLIFQPWPLPVDEGERSETERPAGATAGGRVSE
jgi:hypothetical protein